MKVNIKILSIPPYISTDWSNISSLRLKDSTLIIGLKNGESIAIPNLGDNDLESIFNTHAQYLEQQGHEKFKFPFHPLPLSQFPIEPGSIHRLDIPFRLGINAMDEIGSAMHHNPAQANIPDIPGEILEKIIAITKIISAEGFVQAPKAEPHCNCVYCQIAKAMNPELHEPHEEAKIEEPAAEELLFQPWEVHTVGEQLYQVTNKLDRNETYNVFLGEPLGCTCGVNGCEHIVAVLKS